MVSSNIIFLKDIDVRMMYCVEIEVILFIFILLLLKQNYEDCQSLDKHDLRNFFEYFQDLYKPHPIINNLSPSTTDIGEMSQDTHEILNEPISIEETENTLKGLKLGKSVAEDLISNEMLRTPNSLVLKAMTSLFNHCLLSGR